MGKPLSKNLQIIAACNPYREKTALKNPIVAGLPQRGHKKQMAFRVHPPPLAMIQLMWDYQQLTV